MPISDAELAEYEKRRRIETAYHEAGHAVAAVLRGGTVQHLKLAAGLSDGGLLDADLESIGVTRHTSASWDVPFISFAGPWAQWRHGTETGHEEYHMDLSEWLDLSESLDLDDPHGDYALMDYDNLTGAQIDVWIRELDRLWPVIAAVAALALAGEPVDTAIISSAIASGSAPLVETEPPGEGAHA